MRVFIRQSLLFASFVIAYFILVFAFNYYNENHPKIPKANILFLGDSHIKYHINPDSFLNAYNYGHSGDLLIGIKWKLEKLLESNNKIDTVIISLGYHNFRESYPKFFDVNIHDAASKNISRYMFINNWYFFKNDRLDKLVIIKSLLEKIKKPNCKISYIGNFVQQNGQINDSSNSSIARLYGSNKTFNPKVAITIREIINICKNRKVQCYFIFPPAHPTYLKRVPQEIAILTNMFMDQFSKTPYFITIEIALNDSLFFDGDHLNAKGAKIYTHKLKQVLNGND